MHPATLFLNRTLSKIVSPFVGPTRPNNAQQNLYFFFLVFIAKGFEDRENVTDGISFGN